MNKMQKKEKGKFTFTDYLSYVSGFVILYIFIKVAYLRQLYNFYWNPTYPDMKLKEQIKTKRHLLQTYNNLLKMQHLSIFRIKNNYITTNLYCYYTMLKTKQVYKFYFIQLFTSGEYISVFIKPC